jgi:glutaminyl-tRNA synthetase
VYLWNFVVAGVEVSLTDIKAAVADVIKSNKDVLLAERYRVNIGTLLKDVRSKLPWADGKLLKEELEKQIQDLLGEKTAADDEKLDRKKKEKNPRVEDGRPTSRTDREASAGIVPEENDPYSIFPKPQDNISVMFWNGLGVFSLCIFA